MTSPFEHAPRNLKKNRSVTDFWKSLSQGSWLLLWLITSSSSQWSTVVVASCSEFSLSSWLFLGRKNPLFTCSLMFGEQSPLGRATAVSHSLITGLTSLCSDSVKGLRGRVKPKPDPLIYQICVLGSLTNSRNSCISTETLSISHLNYTQVDSIQLVMRFLIETHPELV